MKIRVDSAVDAAHRRAPRFACDDADAAATGGGKYRVRVEHAGQEYELSVNARGALALRAVGGGHLCIRPIACNVVEVVVELNE